MYPMPVAYGDQENFLQAIHADPLNLTAHGAFADFLADTRGEQDPEAVFRRRVHDSLGRRLGSWKPPQSDATSALINTFAYPGRVQPELLWQAPVDPTSESRLRNQFSTSRYIPAHVTAMLPGQDDYWWWAHDGRRQGLMGFGPDEDLDPLEWGEWDRRRSEEPDNINTSRLRPHERIYHGIDSPETIDPRIWPQLEALMRRQHGRGLPFADDAAPTAYGDYENFLAALAAEPRDLTAHGALADFTADQGHPEAGFRRAVADSLGRRFGASWEPPGVDRMGYLHQSGITGPEDDYEELFRRDTGNGSGRWQVLGLRPARSHNGSGWTHHAEHPFRGYPPDDTWAWDVESVYNQGLLDDLHRQPDGRRVGDVPTMIDWREDRSFGRVPGVPWYNDPVWGENSHPHLLSPAELWFAGIEDPASLDPALWPHVEALMRGRHDRGQRLEDDEQPAMYGPDDATRVQLPGRQQASPEQVAARPGHGPRIRGQHGSWRQAHAVRQQPQAGRRSQSPVDLNSYIQAMGILAEGYDDVGEPAMYAGPHEPFHPRKNPGGFSSHAPGESIMGWSRTEGGDRDLVTWPAEWAPRFGGAHPPEITSRWPQLLDVHHLVPTEPDEEGIARWWPSNQGVQRRTFEQVAEDLLQPQLEAAVPPYAWESTSEPRLRRHLDNFEHSHLIMSPLWPQELFRSGLVPPPPGAMGAIRDPDDWHSRMVFADWLDDQGWQMPEADGRGRPVLAPEGGYRYPDERWREFESLGAFERSVAERVRARLGNRISLPTLAEIPWANLNDKNVQKRARKARGYADDQPPTEYGLAEDRAAFVQQMRQRPDDQVLRKVFADWLDDQSADPQDAAVAAWLRGTAPGPTTHLEMRLFRSDPTGRTDLTHHDPATHLGPFQQHHLHQIAQLIGQEPDAGSLDGQPRPHLGIDDPRNWLQAWWRPQFLTASSPRTFRKPKTLERALRGYAEPAGLKLSFDPRAIDVHFPPDWAPEEFSADDAPTEYGWDDDNANFAQQRDADPLDWQNHLVWADFLQDAGQDAEAEFRRQVGASVQRRLGSPWTEPQWADYWHTLKQPRRGQLADDAPHHGPLDPYVEHLWFAPRFNQDFVTERTYHPTAHYWPENRASVFWDVTADGMSHPPRSQVRGEDNIDFWRRERSQAGTNLTPAERLFAGIDPFGHGEYDDPEQAGLWAEVERLMRRQAGKGLRFERGPATHYGWLERALSWLGGRGEESDDAEIDDDQLEPGSPEWWEWTRQQHEVEQARLAASEGLWEPVPDEEPATPPDEDGGADWDAPGSVPQRDEEDGYADFPRLTMTTADFYRAMMRGGLPQSGPLWEEAQARLEALGATPQPAFWGPAGGGGPLAPRTAQAAPTPAAGPFAQGLPQAGLGPNPAQQRPRLAAADPQPSEEGEPMEPGYGPRAAPRPGSAGRPSDGSTTEFGQPLAWPRLWDDGIGDDWGEPLRLPAQKPPTGFARTNYADRDNFLAGLHAEPLYPDQHRIFADFLQDEHGEAHPDVRFRRDLADLLQTRLGAPLAADPSVDLNGLMREPPRGFSGIPEHAVRIGDTTGRLLRPHRTANADWEWYPWQNESSPRGFFDRPDYRDWWMARSDANQVPWPQAGRLTAAELHAYDIEDLADVDPALWPQIEALLRGRWDQAERFADDNQPTEYGYSREPLAELFEQQNFDPRWADPHAPLEYGDRETLQQRLIETPWDAGLHGALGDWEMEHGDPAEGAFRHAVDPWIRGRWHSPPERSIGAGDFHRGPTDEPWQIQTASTGGPAPRLGTVQPRESNMGNGPYWAGVGQSFNPAFDEQIGLHLGMDWGTFRDPGALRKFLDANPLLDRNWMLGRRLSPAENTYLSNQINEETDPALWPQLEAILRERHRRGQRFADDDQPAMYGDAEDEAAFIRSINERPFEHLPHLAMADWLQDRGRDDDAGFRRQVPSWTDEALSRNPTYDHRGFLIQPGRRDEDRYRHTLIHQIGSGPTGGYLHAGVYEPFGNPAEYFPSWAPHPDHGFTPSYRQVEELPDAREFWDARRGLGAPQRNHPGFMTAPERALTGVDQLANIDPALWPQIERLLRERWDRGVRLERGEHPTMYATRGRSRFSLPMDQLKDPREPHLRVHGSSSWGNQDAAYNGFVLNPQLHPEDPYFGLWTMGEGQPVPLADTAALHDWLPLGMWAQGHGVTGTFDPYRHRLDDNLMRQLSPLELAASGRFGPVPGLGANPRDWSSQLVLADWLEERAPGGWDEGRPWRVAAHDLRDNAEWVRERRYPLFELPVLENGPDADPNDPAVQAEARRIRGYADDEEPMNYADLPPRLVAGVPIIPKLRGRAGSFGPPRRYGLDDDLRAFHETAQANPLDWQNHLVWADFLQDAGQDAEAEFRRQVGASVQRRLAGWSLAPTTDAQGFHVPNPPIPRFELPTVDRVGSGGLWSNDFGPNFQPDEWGEAAGWRWRGLGTAKETGRNPTEVAGKIYGPNHPDLAWLAADMMNNDRRWNTYLDPAEQWLAGITDQSQVPEGLWAQVEALMRQQHRRGRQFADDDAPTAYDDPLSPDVLRANPRDTNLLRIGADWAQEASGRDDDPEALLRRRMADWLDTRLGQTWTPPELNGYNQLAGDFTWPMVDMVGQGALLRPSGPASGDPNWWWGTDPGTIRSARSLPDLAQLFGLPEDHPIIQGRGFQQAEDRFGKRFTNLSGAEGRYAGITPFGDMTPEEYYQILQLMRQRDAQLGRFARGGSQTNYGAAEDRLAFLNAIRANPADTTNALVFADWLREHGNDPALADLIQAHVGFHGTGAGFRMAPPGWKNIDQERFQIHGGHGLDSSGASSIRGDLDLPAELVPQSWEDYDTGEPRTGMGHERPSFTWSAAGDRWPIDAVARGLLRRPGTEPTTGSYWQHGYDAWMGGWANPNHEDRIYDQAPPDPERLSRQTAYGPSGPPPSPDDAALQQLFDQFNNDPNRPADGNFFDWLDLRFPTQPPDQGQTTYASPNPRGPAFSGISFAPLWPDEVPLPTHDVDGGPFPMQPPTPEDEAAYLAQLMAEDAANTPPAEYDCGMPHVRERRPLQYPPISAWRYPTEYADREDLEAGILAEPWDATRHGVLADWHDEFGDPQEAVFRRKLMGWLPERVRHGNNPTPEVTGNMGWVHGPNQGFAWSDNPPHHLHTWFEDEDLMGGGRRRLLVPRLNSGTPVWDRFSSDPLVPPAGNEAFFQLPRGQADSLAQIQAALPDFNYDDHALRELNDAERSYIGLTHLDPDTDPAIWPQLEAILRERHRRGLRFADDRAPAMYDEGGWTGAGGFGGSSGMQTGGSEFDGGDAWGRRNGPDDWERTDYGPAEDEAAFIASINAQPLERTNHLVMADWLQDQGRDSDATFRRDLADVIGARLGTPWKNPSSSWNPGPDHPRANGFLKNPPRGLSSHPQFRLFDTTNFPEDGYDIWGMQPQFLGDNSQFPWEWQLRPGTEVYSPDHLATPGEDNSVRLRRLLGDMRPNESVDERNINRMLHRRRERHHSAVSPWGLRPSEQFAFDFANLADWPEDSVLWPDVERHLRQQHERNQGRF